MLPFIIRHGHQQILPHKYHYITTHQRTPSVKRIDSSLHPYTSHCEFKVHKWYDCIISFAAQLYHVALPACSFRTAFCIFVNIKPLLMPTRTMECKHVMPQDERTTVSASSILSNDSTLIRSPNIPVLRCSCVHPSIKDIISFIISSTSHSHTPLGSIYLF